MEHAVIVHFRLSDEFGSAEEHEAVTVLEDRLTDLIEQADVGEFDGNEFGEGECVLFMYGPDADRLYLAIEPALKSTPVSSQGYAIKRYGGAEDPGAAEVLVKW